MKPLVKVKKIVPEALLPDYAHGDDSGADLFAYVDGACSMTMILPNERALIRTGIAFGLPEGYECQVRAKSGLALNKGLTVLNGIGTIDCGFTGEVGVIVINHSEEPQAIRNGQKIAQAVFTPYVQAKFEEVESLEETERGSGGYGSTGLNK